jgi:predicted phosphodiesterase
LGNVDDDADLLRGAILDAGGACHDRFGEIELAGCRIALLHSDDPARFRDAVHGGRYDLVCYGHTHVAQVERIGRTVVLNPGALHRARTHQLAIVGLPLLEVRHLTVAPAEESLP